jgi:L-lysine 2,3-aminomutase
MKRIPRPIRRTVQACLREMLTSPVSKPMAKLVQANLRLQEQTPLLRMLKEHRTVRVSSLLAVTKAIKA